VDFKKMDIPFFWDGQFCPIQMQTSSFTRWKENNLKVLPLSSRGDFTVKVHVSELNNNNGVCMYALMADGKIIDSKRLLVNGK
jgi:hypothetical protein